MADADGTGDAGRAANSRASTCCAPTRRRTSRTRRGRRRAWRSTADTPVAVLLVAAPDRRQGVHEMSEADRLDRRAVVAQLCWRTAATSSSSPGSARRPTTSRPPAIIRSTSTSGARWAAPRWSGSASRSRSRKRACSSITGDGEMLMGLGALATSACRSRATSRSPCSTTRRYGETGMQKSHTGFATDLAAAARGCGISDSQIIVDEDDLQSFAGRIHRVGQSSAVGVIKINQGETARVLPSRDAAFLKDRFRIAVAAAPT